MAEFAVEMFDCLFHVSAVFIPTQKKRETCTIAVPQTEALALPLVLKRQREAHAEYKTYSRAIS